MDYELRLYARIFLLSGWRRWLAYLAVQIKKRMEEVEASRPRGRRGIAVETDVWALEWQRLRHKMWRATGRSSSEDAQQAQRAKRCRDDVFLFLCPPGESEEWEEAFCDRWWDAPVRSYLEQSMEDGSWSYRSW